MMLSTVAGEQLGRRAPPRLLLEIDVGERLSVGVAAIKEASVSSTDQGGGKRRAAGVIGRRNGRGASWSRSCAQGDPGLPSDIMRGRNDILPRLPIAQHPQLTTDKSAFSPLDKIALKSTPGWRAIWMECCVHDLPPTPPAQKKPKSLVPECL